MKRWVVTIVGLALAASLAGVGPAEPLQSKTKVKMKVGQRYQGTTLRLTAQPNMTIIPDSRVYYLRDADYDLYRFGNHYYYVENGNWYRARSWRGPFLHVRTNTVPEPIMRVPAGFRRTWTID